MISARGTLPKFTNYMFNTFEIPKHTVEEIYYTAIMYYFKILRNHIYNKNQF